LSVEYRLRVYYEDTDAGGIVYYANYLKFIERARTEALLGLGLSQTALRAEHGVLFVVREVTVRYLAPARFEDQLVVTTRVGPVEGVRIAMAQDVLREGQVLAKCRVGLTCVGPTLRPVRVPAEVAAALGSLPPLGDDV
jgi:acyl-CoA thioester hydrolase